MMSGDLIARLWTDVLWVGSKRAQRLEGHQVRYFYYGILTIYGVWGTGALALLDPLQIAKLGAILQNIALGFSSFHTLYVNRTLLPASCGPTGSCKRDSWRPVCSSWQLRPSRPGTRNAGGRKPAAGSRNSG